MNPPSHSNPASSCKRVAILMNLNHSLPWHHEPYHGVREFAQKHGWDCVVDPHLLAVDGQVEFTQYDGVVGRITDPLAQQLQPLDVPISSLTINTVTPDMPGVRIDTKAIGRMVGKHLLESGYRRIGLVSIEQFRALTHIDAGLSEVLDAASLPPLAEVGIADDFEAQAGTAAQSKQKITEWLGGLKKPVAVVVEAVISTRMVAEIARELGLRVPEDVGIVAACGSEAVMTSNAPALSSVEEDYYKLGYEAAALLDDMMHGRAVAPLRRVIPPKRIIVRESSDVFLCDDPMVSDAMRFISQHVRKNLTVNDVAEAMHTSGRTLQRHFDETLGKSVYSEITRLRVDYLRLLFVETDLPLAQIAHDCSFTDGSHLTKYFRKETGVTPSAYRKEHQREKH